MCCWLNPNRALHSCTCVGIIDGESLRFILPLQCIVALVTARWEPDAAAGSRQPSHCLHGATALHMNLASTVRTLSEAVGSRGPSSLMTNLDTVQSLNLAKASRIALIDEPRLRGLPRTPSCFQERKKKGPPPVSRLTGWSRDRTIERYNVAPSACANSDVVCYIPKFYPPPPPSTRDKKNHGRLGDPEDA